MLKLPQLERSQTMQFGIDTYPILYLEVHLDGGVIAPLLIFQRDNSIEKAQEFCDDHNLD